ncbi:hypothetical protein [Mycobacterium lepromatosis]|uniref:hypothetical protein n=1 Tax=Mycobacterium lepromatosis TaxID=480418 RepID=UPI0005F7E4C6|nr:hypothetical protein [Mycobacterium lepromatosis]
MKYLTQSDDSAVGGGLPGITVITVDGHIAFDTAQLDSQPFVLATTGIGKVNVRLTSTITH